MGRSRMHAHLVVSAFMLFVTFSPALCDETFDKLMRQKNYSEAISYADKKIPTTGRDAAIWVKIGQAHLELGLTEKALACYLVATRMDAKNYEALLGTAKVYNSMNQAANAAPAAKKALDINFTTEASWEYSRACIALNKPVEAKKALEKIVDSDPTNIMAVKELGFIYYNEKAFPKAIELLKAVYEKQPDGALALKIGMASPPESAMVYLKLAKKRTPTSVEASFELAKIYYAAQKYAEAAEEFDASSSKSTFGAQEYYMWAASLTKSGANTEKTAKVYQYFLDKIGPSRTKEALEAHKVVGTFFLGKKNYQMAVGHFQAIYAMDSLGNTLPDINFSLAECYEGLNEPKKAMYYLERELVVNNTNVEAYAKLGDMYANAGQSEKAKVVYEKMIALNPNNPKIQLALGDYYLKSKKHQDGLKYFQKSYTLERSAAAAQGMAVAAYALGLTDMARDAAESALHLDATLWEPRVILSTIYMKDNNFKDAKDQFEFMVRIQPNSKDYWLQLAVCYDKLGDQQRVADIDKKILTLDPKNIPSRQRLARFALSQGDTKAAIEQFKELSVLAPRDADIFKTLYDIALKTNNTADATGYLKTYVSIKPGDALAQKALGDLCYEKKDMQGALAAYRAVVKIDPASKGVYKRYVELLGPNAEPSELTAALTGAISTGEADAQTYATLGSINLKQGLFPKAIDMFQKSIQLDPRNTSVLSLLAHCQAKTGNVKEAIVSFEQAIALDDKAVEELRALGDLYQQQNKTAQAVAMFKRYLAKKPGNSGLAKTIADYEYSQKNFDEAIKYFAHVAGPETTDTDLLFRYGQSCYAVKDLKKAKELFVRLAALLPKNGDVFRTLYDITSKDGSPKIEAMPYLQKYAALNPGDAASQKDLADMMYDTKNYPGALAAYRAALAADPTLKGFYKRYVELVGSNGTAEELVKALTGAMAAGEADAAMYLTLGNVYKTAANYPKAIEMYTKAMQLDPKSTEALSSLGFCQAKNGKVNEAVISYEQAVAMNDKAVNEYKALGELYAKQNKMSQSVSMYKKYLDKNPADVAVAKAVGDYSLNQKNYDEAAKYFGMVTGAETKNADFLFKYAQTCYNAKNFRKASEVLLQLAKLTPLNPEVFRMLYDIATKEGAKKDAPVYLKKYLSLKPADASAQKNLGDILYEAKNADGALAAYNAALKADPAIKGFYRQYVELVTVQGVQENIVKALKGAIAAGEADAAMYLTLGNVYKTAANYPMAIEMYTKAMQLDPKSTEALSSLGFCQAKNGNVKEATITYEQVVTLNPQDFNEYKALADLYSKQNKNDQAMSMYKKVLEKNPNDFKTAKAVGDFEYKSKDYDEAVKYLAMVQGPDAKTADFLLLYGQACYKSKNCSKAAGIFKELSVLTPKNPDVFKTLFDIAMKAGNQADAAMYLKKYVAINPGDATAQKSLGDILYEEKNADGALAAYNAALKADPAIKGFYKRYIELVMPKGTPDEVAKALAGAVTAGEADAAMYASLGSIYQKQSLFAKAAPMYKKALSLDPKNVNVLSSLALCQAKNGEVNEAVISYEQSIAMNPDATGDYKALGDLYTKQNKSSQALSMYKKYLEKNPKDVTVALSVGEAAVNAKNYEEAAKYLSMVTGDAASSIDFIYMYGQSCYYTNNFKKMIELFERFREINAKLTKKHGGIITVMKMLAESYDKSGNQAKALDAYTVYTRFPSVRDPVASLRKAELTEASNPAAAAKMYEENTVLFPTDYKSFLAAGLYYAKQKATLDKALGLLKKCAALADTIPAMWFEMGQLYGKLGKDKEELDAYRKFIQLDPGNADAAGKIGEILLSKRKVNDAMVFLEKANALKANEPRFMVPLAQGYIETDRSKEALELLEKAGKLKPDDDAIKTTLFELYKSTGQSQKALDVMQAIVQKKRDTKTLLKYAEALYLSGVYATAESTIKDITATDPENIPALMLYGKIQSTQGKFDDALESYKEISYINPNYAPAMYERAEVYLMQSKLPWAKTFYERALKADPNFALAELGLAKLAKTEKNMQEYQAHLDKAVKLDPNNKLIQDEAGAKTKK
jgi:tetratricopeptide (TPR) repeat protein